MAFCGPRCPAHRSLERRGASAQFVSNRTSVGDSSGTLADAAAVTPAEKTRTGTTSHSSSESTFRNRDPDPLGYLLHDGIIPSLRERLPRETPDSLFSEPLSHFCQCLPRQRSAQHCPDKLTLDKYLFDHRPRLFPAGRANHTGMPVSPWPGVPVELHHVGRDCPGHGKAARQASGTTSQMPRHVPSNAVIRQLSIRSGDIPAEAGLRRIACATCW